jgi:hypothetical protein
MNAYEAGRIKEIERRHRLADAAFADATDNASIMALRNFNLHCRDDIPWLIALLKRVDVMVPHEGIIT